MKNKMLGILAAIALSLVAVPVHAAGGTCHGAPSDVASAAFHDNGVAVTDIHTATVKAGDTVTVDFELIQGCSEAITLAVYTAPDADWAHNLPHQTLTHSMTLNDATEGGLSVMVPCGFYQLDLAVGVVIPDFAKGTYHTTGPNGASRWITGVRGGATCATTTPTATPAPSMTPAPSATPSAGPFVTPFATIPSQVSAVTVPDTGGSPNLWLLGVLLVLAGVFFATGKRMQW